MQDDPDSDSWGGQSVFDVYTKSQGTATGRHEVQGLVMSKITQDSAKRRAFTLIEMMIVISIMLILLSLRMPVLQPVDSACEGVGASGKTCSHAIADFAVHAGQAEGPAIAGRSGFEPDTSKQIPKDPTTASNSTWTVDQEDALFPWTSRNQASATCTAARRKYRQRWHAPTTPGDRLTSQSAASIHDALNTSSLNH